MSNLWVRPEELGAYADSEFAYEACKSASHILWSLSGRKYSGITTVTERYVCQYRSFRLGASSRTYNPVLLDGDVYNIPSEEFDDYAELVSDGLSPESRIRLRGRPVQKIHAVRRRDGVIINPSEYYLVDHSTIQAAAGVPWTPCNTEITYSYGTYPPTLGKMAARMLAMEFAKLWSGADDCALPERVTSISRQGVTYTVLDSQDFIDDLRTGLYSIDLFLKSTNPDRARAKARVFTPDVPRARRYTTKQLKLGPSNLDIAVIRDLGGTVTVPLPYINAEFLNDQVGWVPSVVIRNYGGTNSLDLDQGAVAIDPDNDDITVNVTYVDALQTLGMVDPGTWDLFASRPSVSEPGITETVYIASGNLQIQMAQSSINAFTIGGSLN
jgi:hypothetical protein